MENFVNILLVEDNEGDVLLLLEAFETSALNPKFIHVSDGIECMRYLKQDQAESKLPDLILLDINLPKINGYEVLKFIKNDDVLKHVRVIVLTGSACMLDRKLAIQYHADYFIIKPTDFRAYANVMHQIEGLCPQQEVLEKAV